MRLRQRPPPLHKHPQFVTATQLIKTLDDKGYPTVFAGGCVRDSLLGLQPKDLDIATAAPPEVVERSFHRTLAVGKAFGTIVVIEDGHNFEVTTFRKDGPYVDGRHPTHVEFSDMEEDARRRDFTVNALFYDPNAGEVIDFVGGIEDLGRSVLKTVGFAHERFNEDHLRMLRAARFVSQLGFKPDRELLRAVRDLHKFITQVSAERVFNEMKRLLAGTYLTEGLALLQEGLLASVMWPEITTVDLERVHNFLPLLNWENAFAAVMLVAAKGEAEVTEPRLREWKAPRESIRRVAGQLAGLKTIMNPASGRSERALVLGSDLFAEVLTLAQGFLFGNIDIIQMWIEEFLSITGKVGQLPKPWLNGQDLMKEGYPAGEGMGLLLKALYMEQLQGGLASKEEALTRLREAIKVENN